MSAETTPAASPAASPSARATPGARATPRRDDAARRGTSRSPTANENATPTRADATTRRVFTVDDFMRVEDVVKGERDWQSVRPCVRRAFEGMAYVLRRHERGAEATRAELEALRTRSMSAGAETAIVASNAARSEVDALKLELAEARHEAAERRVEALEDATNTLREELQASRAIHAATLDRLAALETLHASTASKVAVDLFELETQISVKATEGAAAAAKAVDARLETMAGEMSDVTTLVRELEVEVQETRLKANQTALSLAAADVPSIASELEIVKARAARASQDANTVSEALLEVRELANSMERLSDDCAEDAKRVHDRCEHVDQTYARFKEALAQTEKMESMANDFVERIESRGQQTIDRIEKDVQRIGTLGDEIASTAEQHASLVQEQGEVLSSQLKEWGAKVVEKVTQKAESAVTEVMEYRIREIESSTDSAAARNAERAAQETRKCVALAEEAMRKADDENNAFKESVLSSVNQMKAASERADELKQWINNQFTSFAELREESIAALRGSEKNSVDMLSKVSEEHTRAMKRVLGEAEATRGITDAGHKTRIDRLDERFERFEARVAASELRVESCEVSMKLERQAAKPNAEAQAVALQTVEKRLNHAVAAVERDLREELRLASDRSTNEFRKELMMIQDAVFGGVGGARSEYAYSPAGSPLGTPSKLTHLEVYSVSAYSEQSGSMQSRIANLTRKQEEQDLIIHSMHESMERTIKDRPSTSTVRELFDDVSKRVEAMQESIEWDKVERSKTKRTLTELRTYVDDRCTKMETQTLRDFNKFGSENAEMHIPRSANSLDYGRKFVTHPELQAAISIVEDHIRKLSKRMREESKASETSVSAVSVDDDLISF